MHYEPKKEKFKEHKPELPEGYYLWIIGYYGFYGSGPKMLYCQTREAALYLKDDMETYSDYDNCEIAIYSRNELINWARNESKLLNIFIESPYNAFVIRSGIQSMFFEHHEEMRRSSYPPTKIPINKIDEIAEIDQRIQLREKELADADKELDKFLAECDDEKASKYDFNVSAAAVTQVFIISFCVFIVWLVVMSLYQTLTN